MGKIHVTILSIVFICSISFSQGIVGKIYSNTEANNLYGSVIASISFSSTQLSNLTYQTSQYLMFRIVNGNLTILKDNRDILYPDNGAVAPADVFRYFSISLIQKIIQDGNSPETFIEKRNDEIITLTNGNYTLEVSGFCPPICP